VTVFTFFCNCVIAELGALTVVLDVLVEVDIHKMNDHPHFRRPGRFAAWVSLCQQMPVD
jgi:hypothetical protein